MVDGGVFRQGPATGGGPESFDIVIGPRTNRDALGEAGCVSGVGVTCTQSICFCLEFGQALSNSLLERGWFCFT